MAGTADFRGCDGSTQVRFGIDETGAWGAQQAYIQMASLQLSLRGGLFGGQRRKTYFTTSCQ